ncbi:hypothetical protein DFH28DRAFT_1114490 [Melampsora americana]|nr:hypothetical protein DFH28DRAFT_1114490 [Melampsora americana]
MNNNSGGGWLSVSVIGMILKNLRDVVVPQGTTPIPTGLGTKANDVFIGDYNLFVNGESGDLRLKLLQNFVALVESQMNWWGPMFSVAEFPGERLVGLVQKMNNNGKMDEVAKSLMTRFSQMQRLKQKCPPTEVKRKKADGGKFEVDENSYIALLKYYQEKDAAWTDYRALELFEGAKILTPYATEVTSMEGQGGVKFNKGDGNKVVEYMLDGVRSWGLVTHCLKVAQDGMEVSDSLVCIRRLEMIINPVLDTILRRIGVIQLKDVAVHVFILAAKVSATCAYRFLPAWSLGYEAPSMLLLSIRTQCCELAETCGDPQLSIQSDRRQKSYSFEFINPSQSHLLILESDVLVIGSGAGGSVVASILAKSNHNVLVVEKKSYFPTEQISGSNKVGRRMFEGNGMITTVDGKMMIIAASTFGGGTTVNWSASIQTPYHIRQSWSTQYGIHVDQIPQNTAGHTHDCGMCGWGCPFGEKQGATQTWLKDCAQAGGKFLKEAVVERILFGNQPEDLVNSSDYLQHHSRPTSNRSRAIGALVRVKNRSEPILIRARKSVVCSGGSINTPAILLRSGLDGGGTVGVGLHLHPCSFVTGFFDEEIKPWEGSIMTSISCEVGNLNGSHFGSKVEVMFSNPGQFAGIGAKWRSSESHKQDMIEYKNSFTLVIIYERGEAMIDYELSSFDSKSLLAGVIKGCEVMNRLGAKRINTTQYTVEPYVKDEDKERNEETFKDWIQEVQKAGISSGWGPIGTAHQMGSCPMGTDLKKSVIDENGKVWRTQSLYIADASVLPTSTDVNLAITTMEVSYMGS